jgi:hypothetical protein
MKGVAEMPGESASGICGYDNDAIRRLVFRGGQRRVWQHHANTMLEAVEEIYCVSQHSSLDYLLPLNCCFLWFACAIVYMNQNLVYL